MALKAGLQIVPLHHREKTWQLLSAREAMSICCTAGTCLTGLVRYQADVVLADVGMVLADVLIDGLAPSNSLVVDNKFYFQVTSFKN